MRREDLKNWTRDMLKDRIMELGGIIEQWKRDNEKMLQIMKKTQMENDELRKRLEKLESGICGSGVMITAEYHMCDGELWCNTRAYDEVLCRLYKANERISELEQKLINQGLDSLKEVEKMKKLNDELKTENTALKQHIKDMEDACDGSCFSDYEDLPFGDDEDEKDELIAELQDQHQQDCIKINQLHVTIDTLVDKYSRLRNTVGMD